MADERTRESVARFFAETSAAGTVDGDAAYAAYQESEEEVDNVVQAAFGFGGTKLKEAEGPPLDTDGDPLDAEEIMTMLQSVATSRLKIDKDVKGQGGTKEQQAERAARLNTHYDKLENKLTGQLRQAREWDAQLLKEKGGRPYGMATDEGNIAITEIVDESIDNFHRSVRELKEKAGAEIRAKLDALPEGMTATVEVRDEIYEDLVNGQVIEDWEPLEL